MKDLLQQCIRFQSISGNEGEFVRFIEAWAREQGFETDLWEGNEAELERVAGEKLPKHIPLKGRPTLVIRRRGTGRGRSVIFNAHSDVVAAPQAERWKFGAWDGAEHDGVVYGRGACDVKGPLVSALWAMKMLPKDLRGDVMLELVPGEEDCVGVGTLTSVARGWKADASIVLEPTENIPRCASRGGLRFEIEVIGRAVHGTVKWLGVDAIRIMRQVMDALERIERAWNEKGADELFSNYPIARPITIDKISGGDWQGMVCDRCTCGGYLELLPKDEPGAFRERLIRELRAELTAAGVNADTVTVAFPEEYRGHRTSTDNPLCVVAQSVMEPLNWPGWSGFNSGCEAGLRASLLGTPTLVWGPGTLAKAHAVDESIEVCEVEKAAEQFAKFVTEWAR